MGLTYEQSLEHFLKTFQKSKEMSDEAAKYIPGSYSRRSFNYGCSCHLCEQCKRSICLHG